MRDHEPARLRNSDHAAERRLGRTYGRLRRYRAIFLLPARDDLHGVLILSRFAGASHELGDALAVNPYDTEEMADAIRQALEMGPEERRMRMQRMRAAVREHNVYRWAGNLIEAYHRIVPGSDLEFRGSANAPSLLIDALAIAGK